MMWNTIPLEVKILADNWLKTVQSSCTLQVGRQCTRDIYTTPDGISMYDHWHTPWNVFEPSNASTVVDYPLKTTEHNKQILSKYGAEFQQWYEEDGYGLPTTYAPIDSLRIAYVMMLIEKENFER